MRSKDRAFTLIELLIVVAIIAILAAIAVPNFLEAQTRSKVARTMADMRSLVTALEEYTVDFNRCPPHWTEWRDWGGDNMRGVRVFVPLTTPVAYISTIPEDVFTNKNVYTPQSTHGSRGFFSYQVFKNATRPAAFADVLSLGYYWALYSLGPMKSNLTPETGATIFIQNILKGKQPLYVYDPTNGTNSFGWIIRTNKGEYKGEDRPG